MRYATEYSHSHREARSPFYARHLTLVDDDLPACSGRGRQTQAPSRATRRRTKVAPLDAHQLDALFAAGADHIALLSAEGTVLYANTSTLRVLGYAAADFVGRSMFELLHPDDAPRVQSLYGQILAQPGAVVSGDFRFRDAAGVWRHLEGTGVNHLATPGVQAVVARFRELRAARAADVFEPIEDQFRVLIEHAMHITAILNQDRTVRYVSPVVERMLGYSPRELVGLQWLDLVHPDDAPTVLSRLEQRAQQPVSGQFVEFRTRHRDGSWRVLEAIATNRMDDPAIRGIVVDARDVTERKWTADRLQHSLDALLAIHAVGRQLGSSVEQASIAAALLDGARRLADIQSGAVFWVGRTDRLRLLRASDSEVVRPRSSRARALARAARNTALHSGASQVFRVPAHEGARGLTGVALPLRVQDRVLGILELYGTSLANASTSDELNILADQAAAALERARLYRDLTERERRLEEMVGRLLVAQDDERRRIAYDIHDGLAQVVTAAHQHVEAFAAAYQGGSSARRAELERAIALTSRSVVEARRVIAGLRPTLLDDLGLAAAVGLEVRSLDNEGWDAEFVDRLGGERLPAEVESALFRVVQEALTNVRKHAEATRVSVTLERTADGIHVEVRDWGRGFRPHAALAPTGPSERVGLSGMDERVKVLGGRWQIRSRPGAGTRVIADVPLRRQVPRTLGE